MPDCPRVASLNHLRAHSLVPLVPSTATLTQPLIAVGRWEGPGQKPSSRPSTAHSNRSSCSGRSAVGFVTAVGGRENPEAAVEPEPLWREVHSMWLDVCLDVWRIAQRMTGCVADR